jgi:methylated-DNA-[protein]-cysteine S-methyltransferase
MNPACFSLFDSPIGACALVWGDGGSIIGSALPEPNAAAARARLRRRFGALSESDPPADLLRVIERMQALLGGARDDLADIALDLRGVAAFHRRVYAAARAIVPGTTRTYGELARALGEPHAARAVGQALGANPFPILVPCHRVLATGGGAGGFSAPGGTRTKLALLEIEGAALGGAPGLFD